MGIISRIEETLGLLAERPFYRINRLDPVAIEITMKRIIEMSRKDMLGRIVVPNILKIVVQGDCYKEYEPFISHTLKALNTSILAWMREKGYETIAALDIRFLAGSPARAFDIIASFQGPVVASPIELKNIVYAILTNVDSGLETVITEEHVVIGRGKECEVTIDDSTVSEQHACLYSEYGRMILEDLESTNGTRVNQEKIQKKVLKEGARIRFGNSEWIFMTNMETEAAC